MLKSWKEKKKKRKEEKKHTNSTAMIRARASPPTVRASAKQTKHKKRWISECQDQSRNLPS